MNTSFGKLKVYEMIETVEDWIVANENTGVHNLWWAIVC